MIALIINQAQCQALNNYIHFAIVCRKTKGCTRFPIDCSKKGCLAWGITTLAQNNVDEFNDNPGSTTKTYTVQFVLHSRPEENIDYVGVVFAKQRQLGPPSDNIMIFCDKDGVSTNIISR